MIDKEKDREMIDDRKIIDKKYLQIEIGNYFRKIMSIW